MANRFVLRVACAQGETPGEGQSWYALTATRWPTRWLRWLPVGWPTEANELITCDPRGIGTRRTSSAGIFGYRKSDILFRSNEANHYETHRSKRSPDRAPFDYCDANSRK